MQSVKGTRADGSFAQAQAVPVESQRTVAFLADVERITATDCTDCRRPLCGHEAVITVLLGYKESPYCLSCVARALGETPARLRARAWQHIRRHDCFMLGWRRANRLEGIANRSPDDGDHDGDSRDEGEPACLMRRYGEEIEEVEEVSDGRAVVRASRTGHATTAGTAALDRGHWDAGDMACGDLVLELRRRLAKMAPGQLLELTAYDSAAAEDIPAWCGLTRHILLAAEPPVYLIKRKEN